MSKNREESNPALADVVKTMKSILPTNCSIDADALDLVKKCVSRFISSISSEAIARSVHKESTALTSDEIVDSLEALGYVDYKLPIELYLNKFASHAVMKRPPEVVKATRKAKYVNSASVAPRVAAAPKPKPVFRPLPAVPNPKAIPVSAVLPSSSSSAPAASSSSSSSSNIDKTGEPILLPASLTASNRTIEQKIEDAVKFAICHPNVSVKRLCQAVGIPRSEFKVLLNTMRSKESISRLSAEAASGSASASAPATSSEGQSGEPSGNSSSDNGPTSGST